MTKEKAKKIFEKYNPADAVVRCPKGLASVRSQLDNYAKASINLYFVIPVAEFVEIFNSQNTEQTTVHEVYILLLPLVLKEQWYCFYKDYIVHYWAIENFDFAEHWIVVQADKTRYIPDKDEFLRYCNPEYEDDAESPFWDDLDDFIFNKLRIKGMEGSDFLDELRDIAKQSGRFLSAFDYFEEYGIELKNEKQMNEFMELYQNAYNNTRSWHNKGFTSAELFSMSQEEPSKAKSEEMKLIPSRKIGVNEPCPCGSGKKYKKCCQLIGHKANLSPIEIPLFFETFYGLLSYVNEQKKVLDYMITPQMWGGVLDDEDVFKIRNVLWENPEMITDYLNATKLPTEKVSLLKSWRDNHIRGIFIVWQHKPEGSIFSILQETETDKFFAVKGISKPISEVMQSDIPKPIDTVLLPFKDKIIFDSYLVPYPFGSTKEFKEMAMEEMNNLINKHGITTKLGI